MADYFVQSRKNKDYVPADGMVRHIHEVLQMLEALTGDTRFADARNTLKGGETTMSEAMLDRLEQRVMQQGMQKGIEKGKDRAFALIDLLLTQNRLSDIKRVQTDLAYRQKLMHGSIPEQC